jgi:hypothetical protein
MALRRERYKEWTKGMDCGIPRAQDFREGSVVRMIAVCGPESIDA